MRRLVLAFVLALAVSWNVDSVFAAERPNVLFIAVDDLNDWVGCLGGNPQCRTPHMDALAARGTLFSRAYCSAPACNPSRTALMTGLRPSSTGVYTNAQPWRPVMKDAVTLPQHFMRHGYEAVGCGKIFHGGFDDPGSWNEYLKKGGDPAPSKAVKDDPHSKAGGIIWGRLDVSDEVMNDFRMVDYAIDYLHKDHDKPFFLACGLYRPHMPWQVPQKYYDQYPLDRITLPKILESDLDDVPLAGRKMARPEGDHATILQTDNWKYAVQGYLASIAFADGQIGRLIKALDASPHAKNTIIVLWGDHGWHLGEKLHWRKFSLWEEACRAPLMVIAPGVTTPGTNCARTVDFVDLYPTLLELCSLPPREGLDGESLLPLLKNSNTEWKHAALTTHGRLNHAVRTERWRYIRYADGTEELYDHQADPLEWTNLASKPELAEVKKDLAARLPVKNAPDAPTVKGDGEETPNPKAGKKNAKKKQVTQ